MTLTMLLRYLPVILAVIQHIVAQHPELTNEDVADDVDEALTLSGLAEALDRPVALFIITMLRKVIHREQQ